MRRLCLLLCCALIGCADDRSVEPCVACKREVSLQAEVCPHCGAPNPSQTRRDRLAAEKEAEAKEQQKQAAAIAMLRDATTIGRELLSDQGRLVLETASNDYALALRGVRELIDDGKDLFSDRGRKVLADIEAAAVAKRAGDQNVKSSYDIISEARYEVTSSRQLLQIGAAFARLKKEIDSLVAMTGDLPSEDHVAEIAFSGAMRDPWSLALKYKIVDAAAGVYVLTSAGPDMQYGTADDPHLEVDITK